MTDLTLIHFLLLALGTYRLTRLLVEDTIFEPIRERIFERYPPECSRFGYLFTCYWCMGFWISLLFVLCYILVPTATLIASLVLALSAITGLISER